MVGTCKASDKAVYSLRKAFPAPEDFKLFTPKRYKESEEGGGTPCIDRQYDCCEESILTSNNSRPSLCRKSSISIARSKEGRFTPFIYCCIKVSLIPIERATCRTFNSGNRAKISPIKFSPDRVLISCFTIALSV